jgi:hypothetical protein
MNKFKEGDGIVRASMDARWARIGFKATVLCGNMYLDALGKINEIIDDYWELAEDTSKLVTVTHEGNVYELDKHYLFGNSHQLHRLLKIDKLSDFPFRVLDKGQENGFTKIHLVDLNTGTITPAPIELINGAAYSFSVRKSETVIAGIYDGRVFNVSQGQWVDFESCTNIRPMTVTESK